MAEKLRVLTEKTALPIGLVITLAGGLVYVVRAEGRVGVMEDNQKRIEALAARCDEGIRSIDSRLANIEGYLKIMHRRK